MSRLFATVERTDGGERKNLFIHLPGSSSVRYKPRRRQTGPAQARPSQRGQEPVRERGESEYRPRTPVSRSRRIFRPHTGGPRKQDFFRAPSGTLTKSRVILSSLYKPLLALYMSRQCFPLNPPSRPVSVRPAHHTRVLPGALPFRFGVSRYPHSLPMSVRSRPVGTAV